jgi:hypothetical protein
MYLDGIDKCRAIFFQVLSNQDTPTGYTPMKVACYIQPERNLIFHGKNIIYTIKPDKNHISLLIEITIIYIQKI